MSDIEREIWRALERFHSADSPDVDLYIQAGDLIRAAEAELPFEDYRRLKARLKSRHRDIEKMIELSRSPGMDIIRGFAVARGITFPRVKKWEQVDLPFQGDIPA